jgi:hypothetical protein
MPRWKRVTSWRPRCSTWASASSSVPRRRWHRCLATTAPGSAPCPSPPASTSQKQVALAFGCIGFHSLTHSLARSPTHPPTRSLAHSLACSLTHSPTHSLARSLTHSLTHSLTLTSSLTHAPAHPRTHALTHAFKKVRGSCAWISCYNPVAYYVYCRPIPLHVLLVVH